MPAVDSPARRILHLELGRHLYGGALQVEYLLRGLEGQGFEHWLMHEKRSPLGGRTGAWATRIPVSVRGELDLRWLAKLARECRRSRIDLVHVHSRRGADVWGPLIARLLGLPCVITRRVDNPERPWLARIKYNRLAACAVAISSAVRAALLAAGTEPQRLRLIPSAVDTERFRPAPAPAADPVPAFFEGESGVRVIGIVAQLIERKGHRVLLEALAELAPEYPDLRLLVLGQGALRRDLEAQVTALGLEERVHFAGFRTDIEEILPRLYVMAHPATAEGLGVALLQAGACAVPVVASEAGGIPDVVEPGVTGLLVPPGDAPALTQALAALLADPNRAAAMGRAARRRVEAQFAIGSMAAAYAELYREVLAGRVRVPGP